MPEATASGPITIRSAQAYATNWEHLSDEMRRLDQFIRLRLLRDRRGRPVDQPAVLLDQFRGLVLSDEEIAGLLAEAEGAHSGDELSNHDSQERQTLIQALDQLDDYIDQRRAASGAAGIHLSLPFLSRLFHLTRFEEQCVLICLAPELDRKYEKLYAYLQDDVTRKKPSVDLTLDLLCRTAGERLAARAAFDPRATLLECRLLQASDGSPEPAPLLQRSLKLDDRVVNFLLGFGQMDARLDPVARLVSQRAEINSALINDGLRVRVNDFLQSHFGEPKRAGQNLIFYLHGPYGSGRRALAESVSHDLGLPLIIGDVEKMLGGALPFEETVRLLGREAVMQPAALCLENMDCLIAEPDKHRAELLSLFEAIRDFSRLTFLLGAQAWWPPGRLCEEPFIELELPRAGAGDRKRLWEGLLDGRRQFADDVDWGVLASKFRFSPGQTRDALAAAETLARWRSPADARITMADLHRACRTQSTPKLSALARKVEPKYAWDDIVLPDDQMAQLHEICQQAKHQHIVYGQWGFDRKLSLGKGLNALFSGPPGTGKTMAAEVVANELQLDLYRIDLSQVVSKYIGETEKNLRQIFHEAQTSNAILFFDEADALFGKRSEVKDAHDRYANIEIGYLLQKMEEYDGIAILATNLRQNIDEAFVRRMQVIVEFPFPDEEYRRRIWGVIFPREAPLGEDINFDALAREVKLAGGSIKNIALAAAFYAASDGGVIHTAHLLRAARREHQKAGRIWNE